MRLTVPPEAAGVRLDKFLSTLEEIGSRARATKLIDDSMVKVDGKDAKASSILKSGEIIDVTFPEPKKANLERYEIALEILHEDADVIVVDKPAGLVVHPAAGHHGDTLVNALVAHAKDLSMGFGEDRPGIVHRLDKETSGLLVVAKNDRAQNSLAEQFRERSIHRLYQAVVFGELQPPAGTVQSHLARAPNERKRFASIRGADRKIQRTENPVPGIGKWAITDYRTVRRGKGLSFVEIRLRTGRTHQIRVHLSELGHPLIGDSLYGADRRIKSLESIRVREQIESLDRFFLHARELGFTHPTTGERLTFAREWPAKEYALLREWGFAGLDEAK